MKNKKNRIRIIKILLALCVWCGVCAVCLAGEPQSPAESESAGTTESPAGQASEGPAPEDGQTGVAAAKIRLNKTSLALLQKETAKLSLKNAKKKITWKSSRKSVATVSSSGKVKAVGQGSCTITARCGGRTYRCRVTVCANEQVRRYNRLMQTYDPQKCSGRIVLAGSSSIRRWKTAASEFAPYEVLNMGVSGSTTRDWLGWYMDLIVAYEPSAVVLYPGEGNAIARRYSASQVASDICRLLKLLHRALPRTPIYCVSVFQNAKSAGSWEDRAYCNKKVKRYCRGEENLFYIDVTDRISPNGRAKRSLLRPDGVHLNGKGYRLWNAAIVPEVKQGMISAIQNAK